jgi:DNA-binding XRE family transcriptional regulator
MKIVAFVMQAGEIKKILAHLELPVEAPKTHPARGPPQSDSDLLRHARLAARLSRLELALRLEVSQRHICYVEGGRANPSRELLIRRLHALRISRTMCNAVMRSACCAPIYSETRLDASCLAPARMAIAALVRAHDPMPCFVLDADWNLLHPNQAGEWLSATLIPQLLPPRQTLEIDMLDVLFHPEGFTKNLLNIEEIGPKFLAHMREEALVNPKLSLRVEQFADLVRKCVTEKTLPHQHSTELSPLLVYRFKSSFGEPAFFRMSTTFGRLQDINLASLRVEQWVASKSSHH